MLTASESGSADLWMAIQVNSFPRTLRAGDPYVVDCSTPGSPNPILRTVSKSILFFGMEISGQASLYFQHRRSMPPSSYARWNCASSFPRNGLAASQGQFQNRGVGRIERDGDQAAVPGFVYPKLRQNGVGLLFSSPANRLEYARPAAHQNFGSVHHDRD